MVFFCYRCNARVLISQYYLMAPSVYFSMKIYLSHSNVWTHYLVDHKIQCPTLDTCVTTSTLTTNKDIVKKVINYITSCWKLSIHPNTEYRGCLVAHIPSIQTPQMQCHHDWLGERKHRPS